ncbi:MAG: SH3 domain-containing protein [Saprospiraceae bacterium]
MKIIQVLILMLLCLDFQSVQANSTYDWGDTLHVWATSGLNMREGPGTDFPKMKKLEYGDKVQVIDDYLRSTPLSLTIIKKSKKSDAFVMKGHWVRVIIGTQEGYVFDGYLSRLPVIKKRKTSNINEVQFESFETYSKREFGIKFFEYDSLDQKELRSHHIYKNGFVKKIGGGSCYDMTMELGQLQLNEAYLLFNNTFGFEKNLKNLISSKDEYDQYFKVRIEKKNNIFYSFSIDNDNSGFSLVYENGKFFIYDWACC